MTDTDNLVAGFEGRLLAHRRLLALMLARLPATDRAEMLDWLQSRDVLTDGQEDPGAVPTEGLAQSMGTADEFRLIAELAASSQPG